MDIGFVFRVFENPKIDLSMVWIGWI